MVGSANYAGSELCFKIQETPDCRHYYATNPQVLQECLPREKASEILLDTSPEIL